MAQVIDNLITEGLSGKVASSRYTFRHTANGKTFLVQKPTINAAPTPAQIASQTRFKRAVELTNADMADSAKAAEWLAKSRASKNYSTARGIAFAHYYASLTQ